MDKRVFHIDQECFIIYAENYSTPKDRFLRIGNSSYLNEFGSELTFLTLVTPLYLGNPFYEKEIFKPDRDRKIIGLKKVVDDFLLFLKNENVDLSKVKVLYAEKDSITDEKITEVEFLEELNEDEKIAKHSFASFYNDGNIRIFNKNELFFDLKEHLNSYVDEKKEIQKLYDFFYEDYKSFYNKSGMIISGNSLFIFSNNRFSCISESSNWVLDAIRVGINPVTIDFIYLLENTIPDSLWIKTFLDKWEKNIKTKLILKEVNPNWLNLLPKEMSLNIFPHRETVDINIESVRLFFQNDRIKIIYNNLKFEINAKSGFLSKGSVICGTFISDNLKNDFNLIIDDFNQDFFTFLS
ncbi:MAG TPA: hypothetical protein PK771_01490, partial [Spirochaetota bacterium]|nr:hypothetical protein [Spirochaetota bacterium]